ncbi:hypothetical protein SLEP1_g53642 [Rubroshorea leprosula]|uniref:RING-type E3 ubiquitin transferase n=1 Tax=Rubroshorea leprosula TaxID=152421 RepID=A0AAV5MA35_9ROSI|nr:hypothetical protein SLEP1_g53642 [Rubroshorea leprosula]
MILSLFCFVLIVRVTELHAAKDECQPKKCNHHTIQFPFRLKEQPEHCGYSGFELSCNEENQTVLELPRNVKLFVKRINYKAQWIKLYDPDDCLPRQLPNLNLSASPFQDYRDKIDDPPQKYTIFNCSREAQPRDVYEYITIPCLSIPEFQVRALPSNYSYAISLLNCSRTLMNISAIAISRDMLYYQKRDVHLSWSKPDCNKCEAVGKKCRLEKNNNITRDETECSGKSKKQRGMLLSFNNSKYYECHPC